jgi:hypothetical protein
MSFWDGYNQQRAANDQASMVGLNQLAALGAIQDRQAQVPLRELALRKGRLEIGQMEDQMARQKAIRDQLMALQTSGQPAAPQAPANPQYSPAVAQAFGVPQGAPAAPQVTTSTKGQVAQRLMQTADIYERNGDFEGAIKLREQAAKFQPELFKVEEAMINGKPGLRKFYKSGEEETSAGAMPKQDINKPFLIGDDGKMTANTPFQNYELEKATRGAARNTSIVKLPPLEGEEQKEKGKLNVKSYGAIADTARASQKLLASIDTQSRLLDNGFSTGFGTEAKSAAASVLGALGVKDAEKFAGDAQMFKGAATEVVLQKQLQQSGPQTESDAKRISETGAQLGNTPAANRFILGVAKAQANRDVAQQRFFDRYWRENKTYEGAENAWYSSEGGKSLFDSPELRNFSAPRNAPPQSVRSPRDVGGKINGPSPSNLSDAEIKRELGIK